MKLCILLFSVTICVVCVTARSSASRNLKKDYDDNPDNYDMRLSHPNKDSNRRFHNRKPNHSRRNIKRRNYVSDGYETGRRNIENGDIDRKCNCEKEIEMDRKLRNATRLNEMKKRKQNNNEEVPLAIQSKMRKKYNGVQKRTKTNRVVVKSNILRSHARVDNCNLRLRDRKRRRGMGRQESASNIRNRIRGNNQELRGNKRENIRSNVVKLTNDNVRRNHYIPNANNLENNSDREINSSDESHYKNDDGRSGNSAQGGYKRKDKGSYNKYSRKRKGKFGIVSDSKIPDSEVRKDFESTENNDHWIDNDNNNREVDARELDVDSKVIDGSHSIDGSGVNSREQGNSRDSVITGEQDKNDDLSNIEGEDTSVGGGRQYVNSGLTKSKGQSNSKVWEKKNLGQNKDNNRWASGDIKDNSKRWLSDRDQVNDNNWFKNEGKIKKNRLINGNGVSSNSIWVKRGGQFKEKGWFSGGDQVNNNGRVRAGGQIKDRQLVSSEGNSKDHIPANGDGQMNGDRWFGGEDQVNDNDWFRHEEKIKENSIVSGEGYSNDDVPVFGGKQENGNRGFSGDEQVIDSDLFRDEGQNKEHHLVSGEKHSKDHVAFNDGKQINGDRWFGGEDQVNDNDWFRSDKEAKDQSLVGGGGQSNDHVPVNGEKQEKDNREFGGDDQVNNSDWFRDEGQNKDQHLVRGEGHSKDHVPLNEEGQINGDRWFGGGDQMNDNDWFRHEGKLKENSIVSGEGHSKDHVPSKKGDQINGDRWFGGEDQVNDNDWFRDDKEIKDLNLVNGVGHSKDNIPGNEGGQIGGDRWFGGGDQVNDNDWFRDEEKIEDQHLVSGEGHSIDNVPVYEGVQVNKNPWMINGGEPDSARFEINRGYRVREEGRYDGKNSGNQGLNNAGRWTDEKNQSNRENWINSGWQGNQNPSISGTASGGSWNGNGGLGCNIRLDNILPGSNSGVNDNVNDEKTQSGGKQEPFNEGGLQRNSLIKGTEKLLANPAPFDDDSSEKFYGNAGGEITGDVNANFLENSAKYGMLEDTGREPGGDADKKSLVEGTGQVSASGDSPVFDDNTSKIREGNTVEGFNGGEERGSFDLSTGKKLTPENVPTHVGRNNGKLNTVGTGLSNDEDKNVTVKSTAKQTGQENTAALEESTGAQFSENAGKGLSENVNDNSLINSSGNKTFFGDAATLIGGINGNLSDNENSKFNETVDESSFIEKTSNNKTPASSSTHAGVSTVTLDENTVKEITKDANEDSPERGKVLEIENPRGNYAEGSNREAISKEIAKGSYITGSNRQPRFWEETNRDLTGDSSKAMLSSDSTGKETYSQLNRGQLINGAHKELTLGSVQGPTPDVSGKVLSVSAKEIGPDGKPLGGTTIYSGNDLIRRLAELGRFDDIKFLAGTSVNGEKRHRQWS
ncbi:uncharacterized protein LOC142978277 [Anticarsia gemmatalis]|uniref:uncharacterized protein LOC142978277 n=1 Tax=Anticarsia gemmatalis TaxID=129554 RepID=UPI003F7624E1